MDVMGCVKNNTLYINISGELDSSNVQDIRAKCDRLIENNFGVKKVVVDLSNTTFLDSAGIGFLIGRYKKASIISAPLFIKNPIPAVDKLLELNGIYALIPKIK